MPAAVFSGTKEYTSWKSSEPYDRARGEQSAMPTVMEPVWFVCVSATTRDAANATPPSRSSSTKPRSYGLNTNTPMRRTHIAKYWYASPTAKPPCVNGSKRSAPAGNPKRNYGAYHTARLCNWESKAEWLAQQRKRRFRHVSRYKHESLFVDTSVHI